jgi:hypothetical protein
MPHERRDALDSLHRALRVLAARPQLPGYRIPALWNCWGFERVRRCRPGELQVDPYHLLLDCLEKVILPARGSRRLAGRSLSRILGVRRLTGKMVADGPQRRPGGDWIRQANIYGMLVRTTAAWDHNADGALLPTTRWTETGTFLKSILLLPLLSKMGMDVIYLLPVTKASQAFRKGEIGSPYAAKNFFELDPDLHDRLLDADEGLELPEGRRLDIEFAAFVEGAHALGIRVMADLAPRTAARDSDLLLDHPEWFYWIDARQAADYGPPRVSGHEPGIPNPRELGEILRCESLRAHLAKSRHSPSETHPAQWRRFVQQCRRRAPRDLLGAIARQFGVVTPPAFSDWMNDSQPPWSDVTFLRLYLDHPAASAKHLHDPAAQPPYVFSDTIKASRFPGRRPNRALWKLLTGILPFHQRFGVDGARVDMGHALPRDLQRMITASAKLKDADFCFLAEELDHAGDRSARRAGYNAFIGSSWRLEPRCGEGRLHEFVYHVLPRAVLPALAAAETPDTPRAVTRRGGRRFARMIAVLNHFLPAAVPFVNSGLELFERQPMNLGLEPQPRGRFVLPRGDPSYGKLAYFDRVALHWCSAGAGKMIALLSKAAEIRRLFITDLVKPKNHFTPVVLGNGGRALAVGWRVRGRRRFLIVAAGIDFRRSRVCVIGGLPRAIRRRKVCRTLLEIYQSRRPPRLADGRIRVSLPPGDVKVLLL